MKKRIGLLALSPLLCLAAAPRQGVPTGCDPTVMSDEYWAIWNETEQAKIDADIERNRKVDCEVKIDAPAGTVVKIEQVSQTFGFGAHIFNFNQLGKTEYNDAYKASYGRGGLFNRATVSFYWIDHEPTPGAYRFGGDYRDSEEYWNSRSRDEAMRERYWRRPAPDPVIDFLKSKDVFVHGHILIWGNAKPYWIYDWFCPEGEKRVIDALGVSRHSAHLGWEPCGQNWHRGYMGVWAREWRAAYSKFDEKELAAETPVFTAKLRKLFKNRIDSVAARYGEVVDSWDVVNESARDFERYHASRTGLALWKSHYGLMPGDYPLYALLDAKAAFPASKLLCINDYHMKAAFLDQVQDLLKEGAKIDIVGCQMHIFNTNDCQRLARGGTDVNWVGTPATIAERLDMMAKTGRRIHISEVTIAAPGVDDRSRQIQAILTRNIYRKWFSHPKTMGITWWNTVDGAGVAGEPLVSGLFTLDMKKKPVYEALDELINREWKTKCEVKVKGEGEQRTVSFRGFRGRYRLTWEGADGRENELWIEARDESPCCRARKMRQSGRWRGPCKH